MVVQHNMQAANANRMLNLTVNGQQKSTEKLSSGYRINRAADDAAGLAISEKMRSQIRGLDRASTNAQDGISVVQTAEGALNEVHSMLQRMNELATQAANDTNTTNDRKEIQLEVDQLTSEIDRVASTTQFNTMNLLDGTFTGKELQVGSLSGQTISISIGSMNAKGLDLVKTADAKAAILGTDGIVDTVTGSLGNLDVTVADAVSTANIADTVVSAGTYVFDGQRKTWYAQNDATRTAVDMTKALNKDVSAEDGATLTIVKDQKAVAEGKFYKAGGDFTAANVKGQSQAKVENGTYELQDGVWKTEDGKTANFDLVDNDGNAIDASKVKNGATIKVKDYVASEAAKSGGLDVTSHDGAESAMTTVQTAIDKVSSQRATLGAVQNRLEHTIANLDTTSENTQAAESRIRDTDMAKEMVTWSKNNILAQAGQSMLAQANQSNQGVLSLLQ